MPAQASFALMTDMLLLCATLMTRRYCWSQTFMPQHQYILTPPLQMLGGTQIPYKLYKLSTLNLPYTHPYMEVQEKAFCLVHALNLALGKHMFSGEAVLRHIHTLENTLSNRIRLD